MKLNRHKETGQSPSTETGPNDNASGQRWLTWPNLVTSLRIVGSPGLVILAMNGQPFWVGVLVMMLVMTEWLDGFLARSLQAESVLGARLDTVADVTFCFSLLVAITLFYPTLIRHEATWIAVAAGSYLLSWLASWIKFRRLPSYHTWAAKGVWLVMSAGILCLLMEWTPWPFRIAMTCVVLANLEAILITVVLNQCQVNVASIWHVWGDSRGLRR